MKISTLCGLMLILFSTLPAWANDRPGKPLPFDPAQSPEIVVILPKEGIEETKGGAPTELAFNANINYGRAFSTLGNAQYDSQDIDGYSVRWLQPNQLEVAKLKGTTTKTGAISYAVDLRAKETATTYALHMSLTDKRQETPFDLMRSLYTVKSFEADEAREQLLKPIVHFRTEVDSEFGADSLRANFERLGQPARWNRIMAKRFNLDKDAQFFTLPSTTPGVSVQYVLDVFPYRNGAKAVITGQIVGAPTSPNTVDMTGILRSTLDQIRAIAFD